MECESADSSVSLFWLPAKFSKVVWAQRGDFLIVGKTAKSSMHGIACTRERTRATKRAG